MIDKNRDDFLDWCDKNDVKVVITGHTHQDVVCDRNGTSLDAGEVGYIQTPSEAKLPSGGDGRSFRIFNVNGGIVSIDKLIYTQDILDGRVEIKPLSPVELHVYDSQLRHVEIDPYGIVEGEIPGSYSFPKRSLETEDVSEIYPEKIIIFEPIDDYLYELIGTEEGTYGLDITYVSGGVETTFKAADIPTSPGARHVYAVNWSALSAGKEGVTIEIDADGDGIFERTVIADKDLTSEEFALQTKTVVDFEPDVLNLRSPGKVVTAYIELPEGFDVSDIVISSLKLNSLVSALSKPVKIGDYDEDGIPDLMVKFDRQQVAEVHGSGTQMVTLTGRLSDGRPLAGIDFIRVIDGTEAEAVVPEFESTVPEGFIADMEDNLQTTTDDSVDIGGEDAFGVKEAVGFMLFEASETINELGPESFNNEESAFELACVINDVFTMLDEGMYYNTPQKLGA